MAVTTLAALAVTFVFVAAVAVTVVLAGVSLLELLLSGVAHSDDLAREVESLSGHGVVEIHGDFAVGDLVDYAIDHLARIIHHRNHLSDNQEVVPDFSVNHEGLLRESDKHPLIEGAVALLGSQGEGEFLAGFFSLDLALELGEEHSGTMDVIKGACLIGLVGQSSVHDQLISQADDFVLFSFHKKFISVLIDSSLRSE